MRIPNILGHAHYLLEQPACLVQLNLNTVSLIIIVKMIESCEVRGRQFDASAELAVVI